MADRKITELTNITGANLADGDEFVVVDASADETKALTFAELKAGLDTATGFVRITGDTMTGDLVVNTAATFNESGGDNDFRIETNGESNMFFVDGGNNAIGMGETSIHDAAWGNTTITRQVAIRGSSFGILHLRGAHNSTETRYAMGAGDGRFYAAYDSVNTKHRQNFDNNNNELVFNNDADSYDFRVESADNANLFFIDASANKIGINNSSPTTAWLNFDSSAANPSGSTPTGAKISWYGGNNDHLTGVDTEGTYHTTNTAWKVIHKNGATYSGELFTLNVNGNGAIFNEDSYDRDFRVESNDNAHCLFVDASLNQVMINNSTADVAGDLVFNSDYDISSVAATGVNKPTSARIALFGGNSDHLIGIENGGAYHTTNGNWTVYRKSGAGYYQLMRLHTGIAGAVFNEDGGNLDFRVESDNNANMIYLDASTDAVGIGGTPLTTAELTVASSADANFAIKSDNYLSLVQDAEWNSIIVGGGYFDSGVKHGTGRSVTRLNLGHDGDSTPTLQGLLVHATAAAAAGTTASFEHLFSTTRAGTFFNDDGLDRDFRIESDADNYMFFVDAANNAIGIGDTSPFDSSWGSTANTRQVSIEGVNYGVLHLKSTSTTSRWSVGAGLGKMFGAYDDINGKHHVTYVANDSTVFNDESHDINFRIESDSNANMFVIDAGSNTVKIGTSADPTVGVFPSPSLYLKQAAATVGFDGIQIEDDGTSAVHGIGFTTAGDFAIASSYRSGTTYRDTVFNYGTNSMLRVATGGTGGTIVNDAGINVDFRVEGDGNSNLFFVDAGTDNVGIGTNAPANFSGYVGLTTYGATSGSFIQMTGSSVTGRLVADSSSGTVQIKSVTEHPMLFYTENTEAARFQRTSTLGGMFMMGTTSESLYAANDATGITLQGSSQRLSGNGAAMQIASKEDEGWANIYLTRWNSGTRDRRFIQMAKASGVVVGSIQMNSSDSGTNYNTTSDYRLKENIVDLENGITRVKQLQPRRFNFISDDTNTLIDGFIAHEVDSVVPEAVTGTKDAMKTDEAGNSVIDPQEMDASRLVPLLTAALQEAIAKIETLETKVAALESAS